MATKTSGPVGERVERTYLAEGAITKGMAVIPGTADTQVKPSAAVATGNLKVVGIAAEAAASGDPVKIVESGEVVAVAGGVIAQGDALKAVDATGKVTATTTDNDGIFAQAVKGAAADGDDVLVIVRGAARY